MINHEPTTEKIDAATAREQWDVVLDRAANHETRIVIERDGTPVAAVISIHEFELYERLLHQRAALLASISDLRDDFKDVPNDEIDREVAKALAEVRAEDRAQAATVAAS